MQLSVFVIFTRFAPNNAVARDDAVARDNAVAHGVVTDMTGQNPEQQGAGASPAPTVNIGKNVGNTQNKTIGDIIGAYKSLVFGECLNIYKSKSKHMGKLWQRNYHDHIIRDEKSLFFIRKYIRDNTAQWSNDSENHLSIEEREMGEYFDGPEE